MRDSLGSVENLFPNTNIFWTKIDIDFKSASPPRFEPATYVLPAQDATTMIPNLDKPVYYLGYNILKNYSHRKKSYRKIQTCGKTRREKT